MFPDYFVSDVPDRSPRARYSCCVWILPEAIKWYVSQHPWPNSVMYHYTSRPAFESILRTRRMWATDLRAMNDPNELRFGRALINQRIRSAARRSRNQLRYTWLRTVEKQFRKIIADQSSSFSISFSSEPDLAHQWRDYAARGDGFVLGWSIDSFQPERPLRMWVTYDREMQKGLIDGLIDLHLTHISDAAAQGDAEPVKVLSDAGLSLAMFLDVILQTYKEAKWSSEREFRYVYQFFHGYEPPAQEFKARFANGVEKRYIEADFTKTELRRVIIGPRTNLRPDAVRALLDEHGFRETEVFGSEVSLAQ
jgi:hypothetical protein